MVNSDQETVPGTANPAQVSVRNRIPS